MLAGQVVASATALLQRYLFIHAGAVAVNGQGLIIIGKSGAGKTSTVAALLRRGGVYFSDEVALLDPATSASVRYPHGRKTLDQKSGREATESQKHSQDGKVQFLLPARSAIGTVPIEAFMVLKPTRNHTQLASVSRAEMLMNIAMNTSSFTYRHRSKAAFAGFGRLLQSARCYVLESPSPASCVDRFIEVLFTSRG